MSEEAPFKRHKLVRGDIVMLNDGVGVIIGWSDAYNAPKLDWIVPPSYEHHIYRHSHSDYDWCVGSAYVDKLEKIGTVL